jgi:RNA recognition motif-containing protein
VDVIKDRDTGSSKGFAFVTMASAEEGEAAINALNGRSVDGREIRVSVARPREERPQGGGFGGRGGGGGGGRGGGGLGGFPGAASGDTARVVLRFPANPDEMLLSGTLVGGQALANRVQLADIPIGQGHVVSFAIRPFWRWQTQGTYFLAFNAILNWNDLDAGRPEGPRRTSTPGQDR